MGSKMIEEVGIVSEINLIHKSDVYFDVVVPLVEEALPTSGMEQMHHGDIYVYLNKIYLRDDKRWYKANIRDIKDIKTVIPQKQLLIYFSNFNVVLHCEEYSQLLALRDFLNLSQHYFKQRRYIHPRSRILRTNNVN